MKSSNLEILQKRREDPMTGNFVGFLKDRVEALKDELCTAKGDARDELQGAIKELKNDITEITRVITEHSFKSGAYNP